MSNVDELLAPALEDRKKHALYRHRSVIETPQGVQLVKNGRSILSFCSNDYLGLANHPEVVSAFVDAAKKFGVGSGASHLVNGHSLEHQALEEELAEFTGRQRALLFSTGYMANLGVINALAKRGDGVFEDKLNHASLLDAGLLSSAQMLRYKHNDVEHLNHLIGKYDFNRNLIVADGVFSMDGDLADLPTLLKCAKENNAWLVIDDAHGIGCVGKTGGGVVEHFNQSSEDVPVLIGTLGKAFGTFGAFVAGSDILIETLIQFARTYIYTTALPAAVAAATRKSLLLVQHEPERREHLQCLIAKFRQGCSDLGLKIMPSSTAIQPILIGDNKRALEISKQLEDRGFWLTAMRPPTVPAGTSRLRVTLSAAHSYANIDSLLNALSDLPSFNDGVATN